MNKFLALILSALAAVLLLASCRKEPAPMVDLTVRVTNVEALTGKGPNDAIGDVSEVKAVTLVFFRQSDHSIAYDTTQLRDNTPANFGTFQVSLPAGVYDMVVLAYGNTTAATVNSYTSTLFASPTNVFHALQTVNVIASGTSSQAITTTLQRISSRFVITATDAVPSNVERVRYTFSASSGTHLNPSTGLAAIDTGFAIRTGSLTNQVGTSNNNFITNFLLYTDEQTMNVTVDALDVSDNIVISHTFENVGFKRNRRTTITGPLFHQTSSTGFTINTDWLDDNNLGSF